MLNVYPVKTDEDIEIAKMLFVEYVEFLKGLRYLEGSNQSLLKNFMRRPGGYVNIFKLYSSIVRLIEACYTVD